MLHIVFYLIIISLKSNNNDLFFLYKEFFEFMIDNLTVLIFTLIQNYMILVEVIICDHYFLYLRFFLVTNFFLIINA